MKYRLRHISSISIARFGCLLGWIFTVAPSLICGLVAWRLAVAFQAWLQDWEAIHLSLLGFDYTFDLVDLLQLKGLLEVLGTIEGKTLPLLIALVIVMGILGGGLIALTLVVLGWGYNLLAWLTGGLVVELQELPEPPIRPR